MKEGNHMEKAEVLTAFFASVFNATFSSGPPGYYTRTPCSKCKKKVEQASQPFEVSSYLDYSVIGNFCHYNMQGFKEYT